MDRCRLLPTLLIVSALSALSSACARAPAPAAVPNQQDHAARPLALSELQHRLIGYARSVKHSSDISPEKFSSTFDVTLQPVEPGAIGGEAKRQALAGGYTFYASFVGFPQPAQLPIHEVILFPQGGKGLTEGDDNPCLWEAADAGRSLEAAGYRRAGDIAFQRGRLQRYWRPLDTEGMIFDSSLLTYQSQLGGIAKTCVYGMRFSGGAE